MKLFCGAALAVCLSAASAPAATLAELDGGGTLIVGDVVFSNFFFEDLSFETDHLTVDPTKVEVVASAPTSNSVTLSFVFDPALMLSGTNGPYFFEAGIDFDVGIAGSSRTFSAVTLAAGDDEIGATVDAFSEVVYDAGTGSLLEIFDEIFLGDAVADELTSDSVPVGGVSNLSLVGSIEGQVFAPGATASLSGFTLTFDLDGEVPPPNVVPIPASLPLLAAGIVAFGALRCRKRVNCNS